MIPITSPFFQQLFGAGKIRFGRVDAHLRRSIDQSGVLAAQRAVRPIDHRDGCIADQVRFIHVIVKEAVDEEDPPISTSRMA